MRRFLRRNETHSNRTTVNGRLLGLLLIVVIVLMCIGLRREDVCKKLSNNEASSFLCPQQLRAPQCTDAEETIARPRPIVIVAAGGHGSASTFLYNSLRILMRIRDPNTISGWHQDLEYYYQRYGKVMQRKSTGNATTINGIETIRKGNRMQALKSLGSVLVKIHQVHEMHDFLGYPDEHINFEDHVDGLFTSHRDVRQVVRFLRSMGWGTKTNEKQRSHVNFCRKRRRSRRDGKPLDHVKFLTYEDYEDEKNWVEVARSHLKCRQVLLESAGKTLKMDIKAEDVRKLSLEETVDLLKEMGSHLDYVYSKNELESAAKELRLLKPVKCDEGYEIEMSVHPETQYHKGHWHLNSDNTANNGMKAIETDRICNKWLATYKYI